jgi:hypothetical protein
MTGNFTEISIFANSFENLPFLYGGLSHDLPGWVQGPGNQRMRAGNETIINQHLAGRCWIRMTKATKTTKSHGVTK